MENIHTDVGLYLHFLEGFMIKNGGLFFLSQPQNTSLVWKNFKRNLFIVLWAKWGKPFTEYLWILPSHSVFGYVKSLSQSCVSMNRYLMKSTDVIWWPVCFVFYRLSWRLKYFYLAAFVYTSFTLILTFLLLCLNSQSIDKQHNSTSEFSRVRCLLVLIRYCFGVFFMTMRMAERLSERMTDWLTDWPSEYIVEWTNEWMIDWHLIGQ